MFTDELRVTSYGSLVTQEQEEVSISWPATTGLSRRLGCQLAVSAFQNVKMISVKISLPSRLSPRTLSLSFPISAVSFCPRLRLTLSPASRPTVQPLAKACLAEPRLSFFLRPSPSACCLLPSTPSVFILRAARPSSAACSHIRGAQLRHRTTP